MSNTNHISVLPEASIESLDIKPNGIYIDMTMGYGGHSQLILSKLNTNGRLIAIDQDDEAIEYCKNKFKNENRITIVKNNYCNLIEILESLKIDFVDGIIIDLGVSSPQFDNSYRGFSYKNDGPLDMRMNTDQKLSAYEIVNYWSEKELNQMFRNYGDIHNSNKVVKNIIKYRSIQPIKSTLELVEIIKKSIPIKNLYLNKHPAKTYFQALRIAVNNEIDILKKIISIAASYLKKDGRLSIITFHSLEDKIVVSEFKKLTINKLPKEIPLLDEWQDYKIVNTKAILPSELELLTNKRARSAKLRTIKKS